MTTFLLPPGFRATDADDNPLAGGAYRFFEAGTTTPKVVYADAARTVPLGTSVNLNASGTPVSGANTPIMIYLDTGAYKVELRDAEDALLFTFDDVPGAPEDVPEATSGLPVTPVVSKTDNYTVTEDDRGNLIKVDSTGGPFQITLPSAAAVGDGFRVGFIQLGTENVVNLLAQSGQVIRTQANFPSMALVGQGECVWLVSDGTDWIVDAYAPPWVKASTPYFSIKGRASAAPISATPGERWIVQGLLSGSWAGIGLQESNIAEADGDGGWVRYTPAAGWMAYDLATEDLLQFKTGTWVIIPDTVDPGQTTLKTMVLQDQRSSGTNGGSATINTWANRTLQTVVENSIDGAALNANVVTLPAGKFLIEADAAFRGTLESRTRWKTASGDSIILYSNVVMVASDLGSSSSYERMGGMVSLKGVVEIAEPTEFVLQYYVRRNDANPWSLGKPISIGSTPEVYATIAITDLRSLQGASGPQGPAGSVSFSDGGELTIESGVIEVTGTKHSVDTESDASSDDLVTIDGGSDGMMLVLRAADSARTVVVKDGTGNLALAGDCTLDNAQDTITLMFDEELDAWLEICRSNNGA